MARIFLLGLFGTVLAAPRVHRKLEVVDFKALIPDIAPDAAQSFRVGTRKPLPTVPPSGYTPPAPTIADGGAHTLGRRNSLPFYIPHPPSIGNGEYRPYVSLTTSDSAISIEKRDQLQQDPLGFTPPPLSLPNGGYRTYEPIITHGAYTKHSTKTTTYVKTYTPLARHKVAKIAEPTILQRPILNLAYGGILTYQPVAEPTAKPSLLKARDVDTEGFLPGPVVSSELIWATPVAQTFVKSKNPANLVDETSQGPDQETVEFDRWALPYMPRDALDAITTILPSPGADAITITAQGQVVTSYMEITSCSTEAPISTVTAVSEANGDAVTICHTSLSPTITPICNTAVSPLGAPPIPVTDCYQYVTYSSEYGYSLIPMTSATTATPSGGAYYNASDAGCLRSRLQTRTTFYAAFWTDLVPGSLPTDIVEGIVCRDGYCGTAAVTWVLPVSTTTNIEDVTPMSSSTFETSNPTQAQTGYPYAPPKKTRPPRPPPPPARSRDPEAHSGPRARPTKMPYHPESPL